MNLKGHKYDASKSIPCYVSVALSLVCLKSARVRLSCQAKSSCTITSGFYKSSHMYTDSYETVLD